MKNWTVIVAAGLTDYTCVRRDPNDEEAYHEVLVSTFLIDKHEASVSKYIECDFMPTCLGVRLHQQF